MDYHMIADFFYNITRLDTVLLNSDGSILSEKKTLCYPKEIRLAFSEYIQDLTRAVLEIQPGEYRQMFFSDFYVYFLLLCNSDHIYAVVGPYCYSDAPQDLIYHILQTYKVPRNLYNVYENWYQMIPLNHRLLSVTSSLMFTLLKSGIISGRSTEVYNVQPASGFSKKYVQKQTLRNIQNQYATEDKIHCAVQHGNTQMALQALADTGNRFEYRSDGYSLWHMQHMASVLGTIMRVAAREGGVPPQKIHEISERYFFQIHRCRNEGALEDLISQMAKDYCHAVQYHKIASYSPIVQAVMSYLHVHYMQTLNLSQIADSIPCHPNYMCQLFKKEINMTIFQQLTEIRLDYAYVELKNTSLPITEIAYLVGFDSYGQFSAAFKKKYGCSCSQWRKGHTSTLFSDAPAAQAE